MRFASVEELIHFAIDREQEAIDFYTNASTQEPYSSGKETFLGFAAEEKKHKALLEGFLTGDTKLNDYQFKSIPDMKRSDYLVDLEYTPDMVYQDMLKLAMKREEKSVKLYADLASQSHDADLADIFSMLSQEEATHKLRLETVYDDFMATMGD